MVYASDSLALSALEILVHADASTLSGKYSATSIELPGDLGRSELTFADLPSDWRDDPAPLVLQQFGDRWLDAGATAILVVPSAVIPEQRNYVLNPAHADFKRLIIGAPRAFVFDPRLKRPRL